MKLWDAVVERGTPMKFVVGSTLMAQGEASRQCYAIVEGEAVVSAPSSQGSTVVLARRGPGDLVGELAALDGHPRSATVRAVTDVAAVVLGAKELERLLCDRPGLALAELRRLTAEVRDLTDRYALRSDELKARLIELLEVNARETGQLAVASTREELASWAGATRSAVIKALRELEADGAVITGDDSVQLATSPPHLRIVESE